MSLTALPRTQLQLPSALPRGGTIGIVAPASPVGAEALHQGREALHALGFRTVVGEHVLDRYGHLAGQDRDRAADLHAMFRRDDVDAVFCSRGGSGSIRVLRHVDWDLIAAHPKPFVGYSDITILQLAMLQQSGLPSFLGPMVGSDFPYEPWPCCQEVLWRLLCEPSPAGLLTDPRCADSVTLVPGVAEGPCVGGTLSLIVATLGTPYEIETDGCVFCFEDVNENPARVERYLAQLLLAGKLDHVRGFLIGNTPYRASDEDRESFLRVEQVYRDLLEPLGKPTVYGWPHGHDESPVTLPLGIPIRMDAAQKSVEVLAPAVR